MFVDLLDLELEPMTFSQFTPLPSVSRVSYKGDTDSQTVQGLISQKLCCKDPWRSNNSFAFLDITLPALTGAPSSPEIVLDDDPVPERQPSPAPGTSSTCPRKLPVILLRTTNPGCKENPRPLDLSFMQQIFTTPQKLNVHMPQHFVTTFCPCGDFSYHRNYILRHQRTMGCYQG